MKYSTNYGYKLPEGKDELSPKPFNENFDKVDNKFSSWESKIIQYKEYADIDELVEPGIYYISDYPFSDSAVFGALCIVLNITVDDRYTEKIQFIFNCNETIKTRYMEDDTWTEWKDLLSITSDKIKDGAVTPEKTSFCGYNSTPVKVGEWIDSTPVWRWSFIHSFTMSEKDEIFNDRYFSLNWNDVIKDLNDVFVLNGNVRLYAGGIPCVIDDANCTNGIGTTWDISVDATKDRFDGYFGYVEFVTPESNINK